ncbi:pentapeptide repeat-containing protein [Catellatospora citrea]|uniref:Pentapeptide repeat protein n=1 Tax=Catellatospora citrea TaxID=53366 RepID=A0A8J3NY45_9ACTN|nr:pentapeptide repeat-containing protein [Catellatospora citrea]RKE05606.1 pentapeptide repeat protein [Catellatospora citrea]GIF96957.1 hypothetical protein Cci01nite_20510 [Catellatospora citrea]
MSRGGGSAGINRDNRPDWWERATNLASVLSVLILAVGLYLTNDFNRSQLDSIRQQLEMTARGQQAERFVAAVEQLSSEKRNSRIGGVYALAAVMRDAAADAGSLSSEGAARQASSDQAAVVEVLCAFIRTHESATRPVGKDPKRVAESEPDIRAALAVIGRYAGTEPVKLDFGGVMLGLDGLDLSGAHLEHAPLAFASLKAANLQGARLAGADFTNVEFYDAHLEGADLSGAQNLAPNQILCAYVNDATRLPAGVNRPRPGGHSSPDCKKPNDKAPSS